MSDVKFRSAVNGFNRRDVVGFISAQSDRFKSEIAAKNDQINDLTKRVELAEKALNDCKNTVECAQARSETAARLYRDVMVLLRESFDKAGELNGLVQISDHLIGQLCKGYLSKSLELNKAEKFRQKAQKFDMIQGLLTNGEIIDNSAEYRAGDDNQINEEMISGVDMKGYDIKSLAERQHELIEEIAAALSDAEQKIKISADERG